MFDYIKLVIVKQRSFYELMYLSILKIVVHFEFYYNHIDINYIIDNNIIVIIIIIALSTSISYFGVILTRNKAINTIYKHFFVILCLVLTPC